MKLETLLTTTVVVLCLQGCSSGDRSGDDGSCLYEGTEYADGDIWTCADGCNTCGCSDGRVFSTLIACSGGEDLPPVPLPRPPDGFGGSLVGVGGGGTTIGGDSAGGDSAGGDSAAGTGAS